jgi:inhibitor of Bruton tyrosine kinase
MVLQPSKHLKGLETFVSLVWGLQGMHVTLEPECPLTPRISRAATSHRSLTNLPFTTLTVKSLALGPSHTIILTASGDVLTWGSNRFAQLGYAVEKMAKGGRDGQQPTPQTQSTPRRVAGPLKGLVVIGVAVCKVASACWTKHEVFTWGTNFGQLGR